MFKIINNNIKIIINNLNKLKMSNNKEKRKYSFNKPKNELKFNSNNPQTLEEYFIIIGVDPKIATKEYLYHTPINELNDIYGKDDFKPKILSKFPPINKQYINIDSSLIELCFPEGYKLKKFYSQPKPIIQHFLLDNSFYSINYPLKYVTCLIIYENLENYLLLNLAIKEKLGEDFFHNTWKMNTGKKKKNDILKALGTLDEICLKHNERFKSEMSFNSIEDTKNSKHQSSKYNAITIENYQNYYFPKVLCLVSTQHYFNEQKKILKQIYQYFLEKKPKKIPLEKKILTILLNIPIPPKGLLEIEYNLTENYPKIILKGDKMNKIPTLDDELNLIFNKFSINKLLIIFKYILFETKTIIFSTKVNELSYFIYGIISLLFPLHFPFQISSSIPNGAYDILESISPYILGVNSKFKKSFFSENKIDISDLHIFIIDLDERSIKIAGQDKLPDLPKSILKPLHDGLEDLLGVKNKKIINDRNNINFKAARKLFFDFVVNLLSEYELYLKKDYFRNKLTYAGIKYLFKTKEFIESHANSEKLFYKKFTETQMFSDFIYKKMIPKNLDDKLEILFIDEALIKKNNKKFFFKKKSTVFLDSKEYDHSLIYEIPQSKLLSKREKYYFINENDRNNLLLYGQKIITEINPKTKEEDYSFDYYVFPILNKSFYEFPPYNEYFLSPDSIVYSDVDRANTDILSKSMNNQKKNINNQRTLEEEMQNYIYLTYIELWAYSYWYLDYVEKDNKFEQLIEILNKITIHEIELFDLLFEALNKFKEDDKILQLYDCLLKYKILPSSYIYSTVNTILNKSKLTKSYSNKNFAKINNEIISKQKKHIKRTFHSMSEGNILGDKVVFHSKQPCPECDKNIDIISLSQNYKAMKKELFWTKCPFCGKDIIPKIDIILGNEINKKDNIATSKNTKSILHSPYELKNNIKSIIKKDGFKIFHLENFKEKYPTLFWSCVWYFKINKIDLDIILPYEWNSFQDWAALQNSLPNNLIALNETEIRKVNARNSNHKYIIKKRKNIKKKGKKLKKYINDKLLIHNVISLQLNESPNYRISAEYYNMSSFDSLGDLYRKSTFTSINKSNIYNITKDRNSADNTKIWPKIGIVKKKTMKSKLPNSLVRVRLNTSSNKTLLSPCFKPRKLFETINSSDLLSIKENEDNFTSSFSREENEFYIENDFSNKISTNIFNFEDEVNNFEIKMNRSCCLLKSEKLCKLSDKEYKRSNSTRIKNIELFPA